MFGMRSNTSNRAWETIRRRVMISADQTQAYSSPSNYQAELRTLYRLHHRIEED
jgi:hypothetical protein